MMKKEALYPPAAFSPSNLILPAFVDKIPNYAHYASPMIHPTTGETITSYKRLRNNPKTAEIWQTAFGKDLEHDEIAKAKKNRKTFTYTRIADPKKRIRIAFESQLEETSSSTRGRYRQK